MRLDTHLENDQTFVFNDDEKVKDVKNKNKNTKLTAFFLLNSTDDDAKINKQGQLYFVDGPGGCGKTFLYNAILAKKIIYFKNTFENFRGL